MPDLPCSPNTVSGIFSPSCSTTQRTNVSDGWYDKTLLGRGLKRHHIAEMLCKIDFGARRLNQRCFHLARHDIARSDHPRRPLALGFKFQTFGLPRFPRKRGMGLLVGFNSRHLVRGMYLDTGFGQLRRLPIPVADSAHVGLELLGIVHVRI